jgi:hypothetical protein
MKYKKRVTVEVTQCDMPGCKNTLSFAHCMYSHECGHDICNEHEKGKSCAVCRFKNKGRKRAK